MNKKIRDKIIEVIPSIQSDIIKARDTTEFRFSFYRFKKWCNETFHELLTDECVVELVCQHLVTEPFLLATYGNELMSKNEMAVQVATCVSALREREIVREDKIQEIYSQIEALPAAKQEKIRSDFMNNFDEFYRAADKKGAKKKGVVYTPPEVVDFINNSVNDLLQEHFGKTLADANVEIIDPFTGTGNFIVNLIESDLLGDKYETELYANELMPMSYYLASLNIEKAYMDKNNGVYKPFKNLSCRDTFKDMETPESKKKRVIIGNPPYGGNNYTIGHDFAVKPDYSSIDKAIRGSYVAKADCKNLTSLYDHYIRSFRWATDRLGEEGGVIGFISNSSFIDGKAAAGLRRCFMNDFADIRILDLRGNIRKDAFSKGFYREGKNIFGYGSMTGTAITFLVKKPGGFSTKIKYRNIGDNLSCSAKKEILRATKSAVLLSGWKEIDIDGFGDFLNHRDGKFQDFPAMAGNLFASAAHGIQTGRDAWAWNFDRVAVAGNMDSLINVYNQQRREWHMKPVGKRPMIRSFLEKDKSKIKWTDGLKDLFLRNKELAFDAGNIRSGMWKPFTRQWVYFDDDLCNRMAQSEECYLEAGKGNKVIFVTGTASLQPFSCLITDVPSRKDVLDTSKCFPLYFYRPDREDGIIDGGFALFRERYPGIEFTKEDLFHYIYSVLHVPSYVNRFRKTLNKELPRIPFAGSAETFLEMVKAGYRLAALHLKYDDVPIYSGVEVDIRKPGDYCVYKMKHRQEGKKRDLSIIEYNQSITISGIPPGAYEYKVGERAPVEHVMRHYQMKIDKESGIVSNPNVVSVDTGNPRYILDLLLRCITVGMESATIIKNLPDVNDC